VGQGSDREPVQQRAQDQERDTGDHHRAAQRAPRRARPFRQPREVVARGDRVECQPRGGEEVDGVVRLHPCVGEMAAYSFGSCEAGGAPATAAPATAAPATAAPATAAGGKGLRQAPDVLGTEAAGASRGSGVTAAVAVEAVQTFALLHDDVMDGGSVRGRRSACAAVLPRTPREVTHRITGCVGQPLCHTKLLTP
jgi:hypothetical protein